MDFITQYWQQLLALVALTAWMVRLEGLAKSNVKEIERLDKQREADMKQAKESRDATNAKLDKMDEKIEGAFREVRNDIKALMLRQGVQQQ